MANIKSFIIDNRNERGRGYELMAENTFGLTPGRKKKYGIKITSSRRFSRSNLLLRGCERFKSDFLEQSTGCLDFFLYSVDVTGSGIFLHYRSIKRKEYGKIRCNPVKGLRLELEILRKTSECPEKYIMEYDEDRVLGKILRVWEYVNGVERKLTILEDRHVIALKN